MAVDKAVKLTSQKWSKTDSRTNKTREQERKLQLLVELVLPDIEDFS